MQDVSATTWKIIQHMFPSQKQHTVQQFLLTECGTNLPLVHPSNAQQFERIHLAVLKLSAGNLDQLLDAIQGAQEDWRDILVAAGFGDSVTEHTRWANQCLVEG